MKMPEKIDERLFAPCGMNCMACCRHCVSKRPCPGCFGGDGGKPEPLPEMRHPRLRPGAGSRLLLRVPGLPLQAGEKPRQELPQALSSEPHGKRRGGEGAGAGGVSGGAAGRIHLSRLRRGRLPPRRGVQRMRQAARPRGGLTPPENGAEKAYNGFGRLRPRGSVPG